MNKSDVIRTARDAGMNPPSYARNFWTASDEELERFFTLATAHEREECAKVCESRYMGDNNREDMEARRCAEAIRARGSPTSTPHL